MDGMPMQMHAGPVSQAVEKRTKEEGTEALEGAMGVPSGMRHVFLSLPPVPPELQLLYRSAGRDKKRLCVCD